MTVYNNDVKDLEYKNSKYLTYWTREDGVLKAGIMQLNLTVFEEMSALKETWRSGKNILKPI